MLIVKHIRSILSTVFVILVLPVVLFLLVLLYLGGPIATIVETVDILQMQNSAKGTIVSTGFTSNRKGLSRPVIKYKFNVGGTTYESERYAPGIAANYSLWDGGVSSAAGYTPGQKVLIHYSQSDPTHCCLEYGWFKWSIGWWLCVWGVCAAPGNKLNIPLIPSLSKWRIKKS